MTNPIEAKIIQRMADGRERTGPEMAGQMGVKTQEVTNVLKSLKARALVQSERLRIDRGYNVHAWRLSSKGLDLVRKAGLAK